MKVLVTGASGFLGSHLCEYFQNCGFDVVGVSRKRGFLKDISGVKWLKCDLLEPESLKSLSLFDFDVVVHNAGLVSAAHPDYFWEVNVRVTLNLVHMLESSDFKGRLFHISSLAASGPGVKREEDECRPITSYGKSKLVGEEVVKSSSLDWVVVRPPVIFGERDRGLYVLYSLFKKGIYPRWSVERCVSVVYARNVAAFIRFLLDEDLSREVFFLKDKDLTWSEMAHLFKKVYGKRVMVPVFVPEFVLALFQRGFDFAGCVAKKGGILSGDKILELRQKQWIAVDDKAKSRGFRPPFEFETAFERTINWYRLSGWL
ncbi:MAG: NAD(P)-dependent oxidoreductase [Deferribacteres bacterium]|nr:NAD(P)-dependent oxidoreductase [Deferribacteres bacterium]